MSWAGVVKDPRREGVGERLRRLRVEAGIGQEELSRRLGMADGYCCRLENGKQDIGLRALLDIADYFNVSTDWLLGREMRLQRTGT